jgi:hypothetical protein
MAIRSYILGIFVVCTVVAGVYAAAPQPTIVPTAEIWTLDVTFEHPQMIVFQPGGADKPQRFWYVILTLVNKTKKDVDFFPKCELMTDNFQIIPAGQDTPTTVFDQIKLRHQNKYPFLESWQKTDGKLLEGLDNARDIAVIWPDFDASAKGIKIYIAGLGNETVMVEHPVKKDNAGKPVKVLLRKTLELSYAVKGDADARSDESITYEGKRWIMR